jgi:hypothetical protein
MRIRTIIAAAAAPAALAVVVLGTTGTAFASTGPSGSTNGQQGHLTGNQSLTYQDPTFGGVQCNENQHPTFTNVTCKFVNGVPGSNSPSVTSNAASFTPGQTGHVPWVNDFGGNSIIGTNPATGQPYPSTNGTLTYTITGNATTGQATGYTGQVVYTS